jgi:hypothetical protein
MVILVETQVEMMVKAELVNTSQNSGRNLMEILV